MNHPAHPEFSHLFELPLAERLQLVEDLWDSIAAEQHGLPMPKWQTEELHARAARYDAGEQTLHSWDDVMAAAREACSKQS